MEQHSPLSSSSSSIPTDDEGIYQNGDVKGELEDVPRLEEDDDDEGANEIDVLLFRDSAVGDLQSFNQWSSKKVTPPKPFVPPQTTAPSAVPHSNVVLTFEHNRPWSRRYNQRGGAGGGTNDSSCQRSDYFNYELTPERFRVRHKSHVWNA
eukprot:Blabericola_migrator_1__557@NODE_1137_length_5314_cov_93_770536_g773_i0_p6_GENE_NODE_1137_length_5314_cov_93_770536_g773_i0NODE_1137_length_5314_cov_93_770536_g773_i0_p6_ORF_typecomplete_len151_score24_15Fip1/PF05182_13/0_029_NODE_1137_length_5314_cov_93_770536_g773_i010371489